MSTTELRDLDKELQSVIEGKPPVSASKVTAVVKLSMKYGPKVTFL
jgi:hypothetical protein